MWQRRRKKKGKGKRENHLSGGGGCVPACQNADNTVVLFGMLIEY